MKRERQQHDKTGAAAGAEGALPEARELEEARMSFGEHLEELRRRLIWALLGVAAGVGVASYYIYDIVAFLVHPYRVALKLNGYPTAFVTHRPAEALINYMNIALEAGLVLASPWVIYQLWRFVGAGLYRRERQMVYKYIGPSIGLFLGGVTIFFLIVLPVTLNFFISFSTETAAPAARPWPIEERILGPASPVGATTLPTGDEGALAVPMVKSDPTTAPAGKALIYYHAGDGELKARVGERVMVLAVSRQDSLFMPLPRLEDYLSFVLFMGLIFGVSFQTPLVMMVLGQMGLVNAVTFRRMRKYAYLVIAIIAAVATPTPDIFTMMTLMVPLAVLYEIGVLLAWLMGERKTLNAER